jgi:Xaa-Pro aminopeptidase
VGDGSSSINEKTSGVLTPSFQEPRSVLKPTPTADRLTALRALMSAADLDLYLVPSDDAHASEYTAPRDQLRGFISGFTGSAGFAIVAREGFAGLWTDSRYFVQAEQQLDAQHWTLFKLGLPDVPGWEQWLTSEAFEVLGKKKLTFGVDARLISQGAVKSLLEKGNAGNNKLEGVFDEDSLVAKVWSDPHLPFHEFYPPALATPVHQHPLEFAGEEAQSKLGKIVQWLKGAEVADLVGKESMEKGMAKKYGPKRGDHYVVNALDEVAWTLNLRGLSIPYNREWARGHVI